MTKHCTSCDRARNPFGMRALSAFLSLALAFSCSLVFASPAKSLANVRKTDLVSGETVDARGLGVASCPSIDANYAYVIDEDGTVYFERDADTQTHIASVTKIMTAIVAYENASLDTVITVSNEAATVGESSAELKEGDTLTLEAALSALLTSSGNDAAIAISDAVGAQLAEDGQDAQDAFVAKMNSRAAELGCENTLFANAHGLDFGNYTGEMHSTAHDVAIMAMHAMQNDTFAGIVSQATEIIQVTHSDGTQASLELESTDELLGSYEGACGIKTGFTSLAGECFAGVCQRDGKYLFAIVLDSSSEDQRFTDAKTLFDWVYDNQVSYPLAHASETVSTTIEGVAADYPVVAEVACTAWADKRVKATFADAQASVDVFALDGNISCKMEFDEPSGSVSIGDKVGTATFKQRNEVLATVDLLAAENLAEPNIFEGIGIWFDRLFKSFSGESTTASSVNLNDTPLISDKSKNA